jgi:hypothetical protein
MFGEASRWVPESTLSADLVTYYRTVLAWHADGRETGVCPRCGVPRCPDWRTAYDRLAVAGELMAEPGSWEPGS